MFFFKKPFTLILFLPSWDSNDTNVTSFVMVSQFPEALLIFYFFSLFFLLFRLGDLSCSVSEFTLSFRCPFHYAVVSIH